MLPPRNAHRTMSTTRVAVPPVGRDLPPDTSHRRADVVRRIADLIRSDLHAGRLDEQLPYEWDLLRRYNASRSATREALRRLSDEGALRRLPGIGTLRRVDRTAIRMRQVAPAFHIVDADAMDADQIGGARMRAEMITHECLAAPDVVAEALEIPVGDEVLFTEALIRIDETPHRLRSSWIPVSRVPGMDHDSPTLFPPDVLRELLTTSLSFRRFVIEATTADATVADLLEIEPGAAILVNERVLETAQGLPIEFGFTRHRGDRSFFYAAGTDFLTARSNFA
jgi:GntR family transcriptional regulator